MDRGTDARVADAEPPFEQRLRAEGAEQRDVHRGCHDPPNTEAAGEGSMNLTKQALRLACLRLALRSLAVNKTVSFRYAYRRSAFSSSAERRLASVSSALFSLASLRSPCSRLVFQSLASLKLAAFKLALLRSSLIRLAPLRSAPSRSAPLKSETLRSSDSITNCKTLLLCSASNTFNTVNVRARTMVRTLSLSPSSCGALLRNNGPICSRYAWSVSSWLRWSAIWRSVSARFCAILRSSFVR